VRVLYLRGFRERIAGSRPSRLIFSVLPFSPTFQASRFWKDYGLTDVIRARGLLHIDRTPFVKIAGDPTLRHQVRHLPI